jgi:uncharacterized protein
MDRESVLSILRAHEAELRAKGVESVSLFGSVARGDPYPQDVDLAVRLSEEFSEPGLDYFHQLDLLEKRLRGLLNCEVDVVEEPARKKRLQDEIDKDRAIVF